MYVSPTTPAVLHGKAMFLGLLTEGLRHREIRSPTGVKHANLFLGQSHVKTQARHVVFREAFL